MPTATAASFFVGVTAGDVFAGALTGEGLAGDVVVVDGELFKGFPV